MKCHHNPVIKCQGLQSVEVGCSAEVVGTVKDGMWLAEWLVMQGCSVFDVLILFYLISETKSY